MAKPAATPLAFKQDADCTEPVAFATHCRPFRKESRYFRRGVLERENRELRQANEILRKASAYFAMAELDRRSKP